MAGFIVMMFVMYVLAAFCLATSPRTQNKLMLGGIAMLVGTFCLIQGFRVSAKGVIDDIEKRDRVSSMR